ncbi:hypothetical protein HBB16_05015 [Pseudonocardia sp. MCCB 268]|nr:hypothetical protein [Pseudonocardia cytotoxica]
MLLVFATGAALAWGRSPVLAVGLVIAVLPAATLVQLLSRPASPAVR